MGHVPSEVIDIDIDRDIDADRDTDSDGQLVSRMRRGQTGAFDIVYGRYRDRIWGFLRRLSGATGFAEDLFQETWLAAARNAHRLRKDTRLLPWLFTIARNKHRNALRFIAFDRERVARAAALLNRSTPGLRRSTTSPHANAWRRWRQCSRGCLLRTAEVLLLCVLEGLDAAETARASWTFGRTRFANVFRGRARNWRPGLQKPPAKEGPHEQATR